MRSLTTKTRLSISLPFKKYSCAFVAAAMATYLLLNDAAASMLCEVPRSSVLFREIMEKNGDLLSCFNFKMLQLLFSFFIFFLGHVLKIFFAGLLLP